VKEVTRNNNTMFHLFLLLTVVAVFIWSVIKPSGYGLWFAEAIPAIVIVIFVCITYNKFRLTTLSYIILTLLAIIMLIGAHYSYSKVPLFTWLQLKRNHYDRFGHFMKGLFVIVIREILLRKTKLTKGPWVITISISIILAIAALYEIIEWIGYTMTQEKMDTEGFLGAQGDIWDAQWDMTLALIGSLVALLTLSALHNRLLRKIT
jgi:putative membrane protein